MEGLRPQVEKYIDPQIRRRNKQYATEMMEGKAPKQCSCLESNCFVTLAELESHMNHAATKRLQIASKKLKGRAQAYFDETDVDKNSQLDLDEIGIDSIGAYDINGDGRLNFDEAMMLKFPFLPVLKRSRDHLQRETAQVVHHLDLDNDGVVGQREYEWYANAAGLASSMLGNVTREFFHFDSNSDGKLDHTEMQRLLFPDLTQMHGKAEFIADEVQYISSLFPSAKSDSEKTISCTDLKTKLGFHGRRGFGKLPLASSQDPPSRYRGAPAPVPVVAADIPLGVAEHL
jgi:hypothetical protein